MQVFEVKKRDSISFGDFEDLKLIEESRGPSPDGSRPGFLDHLLHRKFYPGNFSLSLSHSNGVGSNPSIIIRHENVDPNLILRKLRELSEEPAKVMCSNEFELSKGANGERKKHVLTPADWFAVTEMSTADIGLPIDRYSTSIVQDICSICEESTKIGHSRTTFAEATVSHQLYDVHKKFGTEVAKEKAIDYIQLFYFVTDPKWSKANSNVNFKMSLLDQQAPIYKLELDGKSIGFAINPSSLLMLGEKRRGVLFEDPTLGCFALVIQDADNQPVISENRIDFVAPIEEYLYENEYRCYYRFGVCFENDLYGGSGDSSQYDFSWLPDMACKNILLHLPWKEKYVSAASANVDNHEQCMSNNF